MRFLRNQALAGAALAATMLFSLAGPAAGSAAAEDDPAVLAADRDFAAALTKHDQAALGNLLDTDFVWIQANGKLQDRTQLAANLPKRLIPVLIVAG